MQKTEISAVSIKTRQKPQGPIHRRAGSIVGLWIGFDPIFIDDGAIDVE